MVAEKKCGQARSLNPDWLGCLGSSVLAWGRLQHGLVRIQVVAGTRRRGYEFHIQLVILRPAANVDMLDNEPMPGRYPKLRLLTFREGEPKWLGPRKSNKKGTSGWRTVKL